MKDKKISRRTFIRDTSLMATGAIAGALYLNGCSRSMAKRFSIVPKFVDFLKKA